MIKIICVAIAWKNGIKGQQTNTRIYDMPKCITN